MTNGECFECEYARKAKREVFIGCSRIETQNTESIARNIPYGINVFEGWSYRHVRPSEEAAPDTLSASLITSLQLILDRHTKGCKLWTPRI